MNACRPLSCSYHDAHSMHSHVSFGCLTPFCRVQRTGQTNFSKMPGNRQGLCADSDHRTTLRNAQDLHVCRITVLGMNLELYQRSFLDKSTLYSLIITYLWAKGLSAPTPAAKQPIVTGRWTRYRSQSYVCVKFIELWFYEFLASQKTSRQNVSACTASKQLKWLNHPCGSMRLCWCQLWSL